MRRRSVAAVTAGMALLGSIGIVAAIALPAGSALDGRAQPSPVFRPEFSRPRTMAIDDGASSMTLDAGASTTLSSSIAHSAGARTLAHLPSFGTAPRSVAYTLDLYRRGDFVSQARADWCVPAAIQTMARLIGGPAARSLPSQAALDHRSRALSSPRLVGLGSEPQGWSGALNALGFGRYGVVAKRTFADAVAAAAKALRLTHRPVGLLVWRGAHAWVMSGFEATGDPAGTGNVRITAVRITDPWYPRRLSAWGRSRPPDAKIDLATLSRSFLPWRRPTVRYAELDARYVLILPEAAVGAVSSQP